MPGIYVHIPFCVKKCNYCDFASYPCLLEKSDEYITALCNETETYKGEKADTVYFGGGTPSILDAKCLFRVMEAVQSVFDVSKNAEITIEVNPGTVTPDKLKDIRSIGFNRVSLGSQTFSDSELEILGRIHTSRQTLKCYADVRNAGFNNVSLDLMYAIPGQNMKSLSTSVMQVLKLSPEHISCYGLKFEPDTPFYDRLERGELSEKSDDEYADMYAMIVQMLNSEGYSQYELSNFSRPGFESRHNMKHWLLQDYIGLGLGASSCYNGKRYTNSTDFDEYVTSFKKAEYFELTTDDKMSEYMILSLRLTNLGANKSEFEKRFGIPMTDVFGKAIRKHLSTGMLRDCGDRIVLSKNAYYVSNSVLCDFI